MKGGRFSPGQACVAFKMLAGLHILNFTSKAIDKSIYVDNEICRLNSNILQPLPEAPYDPSNVTFALLNVRSILKSVHVHFDLRKLQITSVMNITRERS